MAAISEIMKSRQDLREFKEQVVNYDELPFCVDRVVADPEDATGGEQVDRARRFLADQYTKNGSIDESMLREPGGPLCDAVDPYWRRATYFVVRSKQDPAYIYATARLISPENGMIDSLQVHLDELPDQWYQYVLSLNSEKVVEIASLVKGQETSTLAVMDMIRHMAHYSQGAGIEHWIWGLQPKLVNKYSSFFGSAITRMGQADGRVHLGKLKPEYVPYLLNVDGALERAASVTVLDRLIGRSAVYDFMTTKPHDNRRIEPETAW